MKISGFIIILLSLLLLGCELNRGFLTDKDSIDQEVSQTGAEMDNTGFNIALCEIPGPGPDAIEYKITDALIIISNLSGITIKTNWKTGGPTNIVFRNITNGLHFLSVIETDTYPLVYTNNTNFTIKKGFDYNLKITLGGNINLVVKFFNRLRNAWDDTIFPWYFVKNNDKKPLDLSKLKLRYYYTLDGTSLQWFVCDHSGIMKTYGYYVVTEYVYGQFRKITPAKKYADEYLEIGFNPSIGYLRQGETIYVQSRIYNNCWADYYQMNDYSFDPCDSDYSYWNKITAYYDGNLIYGTEPK